MDSTVESQELAPDMTQRSQSPSKEEVGAAAGEMASPSAQPGGGRPDASDKRAKRTLIIVPAHNEEMNIGGVLSELRGLNLGHDVLVVNDASTDGTQAVIEQHEESSLRLSSCLGYGGALQAGFKYAVQNGYDYVVQLDADGQHDPRSIPVLLHEVQSAKADIALGSRFLGQVLYELPLSRRWGILLFRTVVSLLMKQSISDPTSGFQALSQKVVEFFVGDNYPMDYPDSDVLLTAHYAGFRIKEVPVIMRARICGESIHGGLSAIYYLTKMLVSIPMVLLRDRSRVRNK